ncbi:MAG TPA: ATP-dependent Clp protease adaptor ClpS [Roseiflexaceae bacterium]|nr:ATP-dependent Clp protease adaptor ClpS [Roseiflexaceae bacterium]HMP39262.1 ATP-dependent Clp protease adaptor ClpS [Roseiflexaceae bacterium]
MQQTHILTQTPLPPTKTVVEVEYRILDQQELERPYKVIIENDDVTPMDFVVMVLLIVFERELDQAIDIMYEAHTSGRALVGMFPFAEARDRVYQAHSLARDAEYPLSFYLEPEDA